MADWRIFRVLICLLIVMLSGIDWSWAGPVETTPPAVDQPGILHRLASDPLMAQPADLVDGRALPGDAVPTPCPPQVDLSQPLSLVGAVDLALCSNPQLRDTWAQIKVQVAQVGQARSAYLPTLSAQVSELNNRTVYPGFSSANNTTQGHMTFASLNWLLFDFGGRSANLEASDTALKAAIDDHDAEMQKLLGEVISDYFNAMAAQAKVDASTKAEELAREIEDSANRRLQHGTGNRADLTQAQTASAKAELTLAHDTGERNKTLAELVYALGLTPGTEIVLPELAEPDRSVGIKALLEWVRLAKHNHPAIRAAREQWTSAQAKVRSARSDGLPSLSFVTTFDQNGYPNQGLQPVQNNITTVGLTLNIPIFTGFMQHYKIDEAKARANAAQAQMQDTEHQILKQVVTAYGDAVTAFDSIDAARKLLESAQVAMESAQNRYDHGVGTMIELLTAQSALADASQQWVQSLAQWAAGRLELLAASGVLGHAALGDSLDKD